MGNPLFIKLHFLLNYDLKKKLLLDDPTKAKTWGTISCKDGGMIYSSDINQEINGILLLFYTRVFAALYSIENKLTFKEQPALCPKSVCPVYPPEFIEEMWWMDNPHLYGIYLLSGSPCEDFDEFKNKMLYRYFRTE